MILKKKSDLTKTKRIWPSPKQPVFWDFSYVMKLNKREKIEMHKIINARGKKSQGEIGRGK